MQKIINKSLYYAVPDLKQKNWTDTLINRYLKEPDDYAPNPHYRCAAPMKLYLRKRVDRVEKKEAFLADREKSIKRSRSAYAGVCTKYNKIIEYVTNLKIVLPDYGEEELFERAVSHYCDYQCYLGRYEYSCYGVSSFDMDFLRRISCNYIRHQETSYEEELERMYGKVGVQEAHDILKERIINAIYKKYQWKKAA